MDGVIDQETRGWNDPAKLSYVMRSKEDAMDYRYMTEPDLPAVHLDPHRIDTLRAQLQEFPVQSIERYKNDYGFNKEYINGIMIDTAMQSYFESCVTDGFDPKLIATWLVGPIARWCNENEQSVDALPMKRSLFLEFLSLLHNGTLTNQTAKAVIADMIQNSSSATEAMETLGIRSITPEQISVWVEQIFLQNPALLADLKA
jgi:aspartyl-tRNA(Asn)/glutamyl-tRNA(Gln) amidotransferase subunit B